MHRNAYVKKRNETLYVIFLFCVATADVVVVGVVFVNETFYFLWSTFGLLFGFFVAVSWWRTAAVVNFLNNSWQKEQNKENLKSEWEK